MTIHYGALHHVNKLPMYDFKTGEKRPDEKGRFCLILPHFEDENKVNVMPLMSKSGRVGHQFDGNNYRPFPHEAFLPDNIYPSNKIPKTGVIMLNEIQEIDIKDVSKQPKSVSIPLETKIEIVDIHRNLMKDEPNRRIMEINNPNFRQAAEHFSELAFAEKIGFLSIPLEDNHYGNMRNEEINATHMQPVIEKHGLTLFNVRFEDKNNDEFFSPVLSSKSKDDIKREWSSPKKAHDWLTNENISFKLLQSNPYIKIETGMTMKNDFEPIKEPKAKQKSNELEL